MFKVKSEWSYTLTYPLCLHRIHRDKFTLLHFSFYITKKLTDFR